LNLLQATLYLVILVVGVQAIIITMRILTERRSEAKKQHQELLRHDQELLSQAISIRYTTTPAKVRNDFFIVIESCSSSSTVCR